MKGWIYFARHGLEGPIKIGRTEDPFRRLMDLSVGTPIELVLLGAMLSEQTSLEEEEIKQRLSVHHIRGEWFKAEAVLNEMARLGSRVVPPDQVKACRGDCGWSKSANLNIRVSSDEKALWRATARAQNKSLSEWVREVLNPVAGVDGAL